MIRGFLWLVQVVLVAPAIYSSIVSLWGLRSPKQGFGDGDGVRVRVVVPAHDEGAVIEQIAVDLSKQTHPSLIAHVLADRCSDDTAARASRHIDVVERTSGSGGKGGAIAWYLEEYPLQDEVLLVLDADNRVDPSYVGAVAGCVEAGNPVVQTYLDVVNPDGSPLATANALTYWASNRMVQLARTNLGWSADLGGTGMAISSDALEAAGGFADDLADDLALNIRLNLNGYRTYWLHSVKLRDEKPVGTTDTVAQRARWARGKRDVKRMWGRRLFTEAVRKRSAALGDLAFRLYNPGRSFIALMIGLLAVVSAIAPDLGLWSPWVLGGIAAFVVMLPVVFLLVDRIPPRYVIRYPYVTLIAMLWIPVQLASRLIAGWNRTTHRGS